MVDIIPTGLPNATGNVSNATTAPDPYGTATIVFVSFLVTVLSAVTVFGNLLVLVAFYVDKNIRQPSNYFILSLAISDFIIGIEGYPLLTVMVLKQSWPLGWFICDLWLSVDYTVCLASIYTVLLITIDRYCSVRIPTIYRNWRTPGKIQLMIIIVWVIPTLLFFISIFGWSSFVGGRQIGSKECLVQFMKDPYFNMSMYISYYWSTLVVMVILYAGIYRAAYQLQRRSERKQRKMSMVRKLGENPRSEQPECRELENREPSPRKSSSTLFTSDAEPETTSQSRKRKRKPRRKFTTRRFLGKVHSRFGGETQKESLTPISCHKDSEMSLFPQRNTSKNILPVPSLRVFEDPALSCSMVVTDTQIHPESSGREQASASPAPSNVINTAVSSGRKTPKFDIDSDDDDDQHSQISKRLKFIDHDSISKTFESASIVESSCSGGSPIREDLFSTGTVALSDVCQEFSCISYMSRDDVRLSIRSPQKHRLHRLKRDRSSSLNARSGSTKSGNRLTHKLRSVKSNPVAPMVFDDPARDPVRRLLLPAHCAPSVVPLSHMEHLDLDVQTTRRGGIWDRIWYRFSYFKAAKRNVFSHNGLLKRPTSKRSTPNFRTAILGALQRKPMNEYHKSKSENRARKALRVITVILGAFIIFWTPFYVFATVVGFHEDAVPLWLYNISYYLCYLNSTINPFCYALANAQFKKVFLRLLKGDLHVS